MGSLVTIATPCYNVEKYISKYLDSILNQTYKNIELILINDGSTDNTAKIIKEYEKRLEKRLVSYTYIYQENAGQASALKKALPLIKGEYFVWPDSDDYYEIDAISKMVDFLDNNPDYSVVRSKMNIINDSDINKVEEIFDYGENFNKEDVFEDYILENRVFYCGGIMIRMNDYYKNNPNLDFFCNRGGQNWQILLPALYKNKCGYVDYALYNYIVHQSSHSHNLKTKQANLDYMNNHKEIIMNTLKIIKMPTKERKYYNDLVEKKYIKRFFLYAASIYDRKMLREYYNILKEKEMLTKNDKIEFLKGQNIIFNIVIRGLMKVKRVMKGI